MSCDLVVERAVRAASLRILDFLRGRSVSSGLDSVRLGTEDSLRLTPLAVELALPVASFLGLEASRGFGFGPRTPRQEGAPQWHSWAFLEENGSKL